VCHKQLLFLLLLLHCCIVALVQLDGLLPLPRRAQEVYALERYAPEVRFVSMTRTVHCLHYMYFKLAKARDMADHLVAFNHGTHALRRAAKDQIASL